MNLNTTKKIMIIEDDLRLAELIKEYLEKQGYEISVESHGDRAANRIANEIPDLVILDLMLPGKDGLSICRDVRKKYQGIILILTAREDDMDQVAGLELGADDYVKKPVEPRVLLARIRALLRRTNLVTDRDHILQKNEIYKFDSLEINPASRDVTFAGEIIDLTTTEFDVLCIFAQSPGKVLDRDFLYQSVKGIDYDGLDRSMDIGISRLRKKLKDNPEHPFRIKTIWGRGYLFVEDAWK